MTPQAFTLAGEALYGSRWIAEMARTLRCSRRSLERWRDGSWSVPQNIEHEIGLLISARRALLANMERDNVEATRTN